MFKKWLGNPLRMSLDDRDLTFGSIGDFEFALASRTEVPASKVSELVRLAPEELRDEATRIRQVEKLFVDVLARSLEEGNNIGYLLRELDAKLFSQDHQWRAIIIALTDQPSQFDDFKKIALIKYMQYLGSRQGVLSSLYEHKSAELRPAPEPDAGDAASLMRETLIFDVSGEQRLVREETASRFVRLPRGETVEVEAPTGAEVEIILSRHRFRLKGLSFATVDGEAHPLAEGRNTVGRQPENDVVVEGDCRDVSRKHLIVDVIGPGRYHLTDLSSHGTFVPKAVLPGPLEL